MATAEEEQADPLSLAGVCSSLFQRVHLPSHQLQALLGNNAGLDWARVLRLELPTLLDSIPTVQAWAGAELQAWGTRILSNVISCTRWSMLRAPCGLMPVSALSLPPLLPSAQRSWASGAGRRGAEKRCSSASLHITTHSSQGLEVPHPPCSQLASVWGRTLMNQDPPRRLWQSGNAGRQWP